MIEEYEKEIKRLKIEIMELRTEYKELGKKYNKVSDELIMLKAGKPIQRIKEDKNDNTRG